MKIALITDTHISAEARDFTANCAAALAWIDAADADLVVHLGDITADGVEDPVQFAAARETLARARTPMRLIPGNHDIGDNPVPGLEAGHGLVQPQRLALYRTVFGPDYWTVPAAGWTLIGLNAQLFGLGEEEEAAQFAWLEQALAAATGPVGLMLHKPLFRTAPDDAEVHPRYVPLAPRRRLLNLLSGCDLRFVINGHTHQLRRHHHGGVDHVWVPSSAFVLPDAMQEWIGDKVVGLMTLTLDETGHRFKLHVPRGVEQHDLAGYADVFPKLRSVLAKVGADGRST